MRCYRRPLGGLGNTTGAALCMISTRKSAPGLPPGLSKPPTSGLDLPQLPGPLPLRLRLQPLHQPLVVFYSPHRVANLRGGSPKPDKNPELSAECSVGFRLGRVRIRCGRNQTAAFPIASIQNRPSDCEETSRDLEVSLEVLEKLRIL